MNRDDDIVSRVDLLSKETVIAGQYYFGDMDLPPAGLQHATGHFLCYQLDALDLMVNMSNYTIQDVYYELWICNQHCYPDTMSANYSKWGCLYYKGSVSRPYEDHANLELEGARPNGLYLTESARVIVRVSTTNANRLSVSCRCYFKPFLVTTRTWSKMRGMQDPVDPHLDVDWNEMGTWSV